MQQRQQVAQLSKVPLFANCSKRELARLLSRVRSEMVEAGHTLFLEGAPSGNLYIILSGSAVVRKNGRRIARVGAPCVASSAMSVSEQKRGASMRAQTCRVMNVCITESLDNQNSPKPERWCRYTPLVVSVRSNWPRWGVACSTRACGSGEGLGCRYRDP